MKKTIKLTLTSLLSLILVLCTVSCAGTPQKEADELWQDAIYTEDTVLGEGARTAVVEYVIGEKKITLTIRTNEETLGGALAENDLIEGENGLYTKVNGVVADYNIDATYWSFYIDGNLAMVGVDDTPIVDGAVYRLERSK